MCTSELVKNYEPPATTYSLSHPLYPWLPLSTYEWCFHFKPRSQRAVCSENYAKFFFQVCTSLTHLQGAVFNTDLAVIHSSHYRGREGHRRGPCCSNTGILKPWVNGDISHYISTDPPTTWQCMLLLFLATGYFTSYYIFNWSADKRK